MAATGDFGAALTAVAETLTDEAMKRRAKRQAQALIAVGVTSFESMLAIIIDEGAGTAVRASACWFAGRLGQKRAAQSLLFALRKGRRNLRWEAAGALACLAARRSVKPLVGELSQGRMPDLRAASAFALGYVGGEAATVALLQALGDECESGVVRANAAEALGNLRDGRACKALIAALSDPSAEIRFWVAFALGQIGCRDALPYLRKVAVTDTREVPGWWSVSKEASDAMKEIRRAGKGKRSGALGGPVGKKAPR